MSELAAARAVAAAHAAAVDPARWTEALEALAEALEADTAAMGLRHTDGSDTGCLCPRTDPGWHARYHDGLRTANYIWAAAARAAPGTALTESMVAPRETYARSVIFNEFIRPQGMEAVLTLTLARGAGGAALMTFGRRAGRERFGAAELERAGRLAQLVAGAARAATLGAATAFARQLDRVGAAALVCDAAARPRAANAAAEALAGTGALRWGPGPLSVPGAPGLARAVAAAARPRAGWPPPAGADLRTPGGLAIRVAPWCGAAASVLAGPPLALVIVEAGPRGAAADAAARYRLTPREAEIAAALAAGATLRAAADAGGISLTTARTHLQRIFDKTGARSQNALIALLLPRSWPDPPH